MAKKFLKTVLTLAALGAASKVAYDKYKDVKSEFEKEENDSLGLEVKKYNAIFQNKVVEVDDEIFTGCEVKTIGSKAVIDLGLAVFERDVYIDFTSKASSVTIVLPEGVNAACDIEKKVSRVENLVENTDEDGIHTVYIIGTAYASSVQVVPVDFYMDDDDDFEDIDDFEGEPDEEDKADGEKQSESKKEEAKDIAKDKEGDTQESTSEVESVREAAEAADETADKVESKVKEEVKKSAGRRATGRRSSKSVAAESENDDLENMEDADAEEDLRKLDGEVELIIEEVTDKK